jgi:hypothetical protein
MRPEWDLRYLSNSSALYLSGKAQYQTNSHGLNFAVGRPSGVVVWNPLLQVFGRTDIFLLGRTDAADDVDVPHGRHHASSEARSLGYDKEMSVLNQPVFALWALPGTTLRPSGSARLRHA